MRVFKRNQQLIENKTEDSQIAIFLQAQFGYRESRHSFGNYTRPALLLKKIFTAHFPQFAVICN